jgi:hypothetical protein
LEQTRTLDSGRVTGWSAAVPLVCAAHCLTAPLLVALAPALALPEALEPVVQGATVVFAGAVAWAGIRLHGRLAVLLPMAAGVALWAVALAAGWTGTRESAVVVAGSLAIAGGLWWNARLRHRATCHACGCGAHAEHG